MDRKSQQSHKRKPSHPSVRVLWIPGLGADRRMYDPLVRALNRDASVQWDHHFVDYPQDKGALSKVRSLEDLASLTYDRVTAQSNVKSKNTGGRVAAKKSQVKGHAGERFKDETWQLRPRRV